MTSIIKEEQETNFLLCLWQDMTGVFESIIDSEIYGMGYVQKCSNYITC